MKKKYWIYAGIALLLIILLVLAARKNKNTETKVDVSVARKRTIVEEVTASGHIKPEKEIKITPYISGEVIELFVKEGEEVQKGQLLAKIDPKIYVSNLERAKASLQQQKAKLSNAKARLAQTKAKLEKAKSDFDRSQKLYEQKVIPEAEYEKALSSYNVAKQELIASQESVKAARFAVQSTEANLKEAQENLSRTAVYAPASGTVSSLKIEQGERVSGASQFSAGTELMKLANLNRMIVEVDVNENDIIKVKPDDTATIEVDAYAGKKFKGIVKEISTSAKNSGLGVDEVTNYPVKILILPASYQNLSTGNESPFRPGMSASVDIRTNVHRAVVSVPIQAVTLRTDSSGIENEVVFRYENGEARMQKVKTGIQDREFIEITKGVNAGNEIITGPYRTLTKTLKDKQKVKKKTTNGK